MNEPPYCENCKFCEVNTKKLRGIQRRMEDQRISMDLYSEYINMFPKPEEFESRREWKKEVQKKRKEYVNKAKQAMKNREIYTYFCSIYNSETGPEETCDKFQKK